MCINSNSRVIYNLTLIGKELKHVLTETFICEGGYFNDI